ncbi:MAG: PAS domain S-box protein, partial [Myxococcales bacterium]|nr:PAS domain S-box protein [Myxococcales bacterium]
PADVDERSLFHEVASDIAFALLTARRADERAELQTDLARSEARFRSIFNQVLDGILVLDLETSKPHLANDAFCRMTGYSDAELRELHVGDFHPVNDIGEVLEGFERHIKGEVQRAEDIPMKRKDGSVFYADINTALVEVDGKSTLVGLFRDVTERKNVQAGLAQADRLSSMGMLAAGVAHEINNPLTYVLYSLESLVHEVPRLRESLRRARADLATRLGDEELVAVVGVESPLVDSQALVEVEERFSDALSGAQRIKTIARGLGTFSRVEKDDPVDIDVAYALECAATIAANEVKYRARLIKDYSPVPPVMATEGRLSQVFLNLIVNAAHAIPEGRIESNEIRISTRREGGEVCVEVRDTGKGIAAENLPRIFEPFFTTKPVGVGSGLGLSISRNIVESYGGRLEVKSQLGRGSSFFVYLPIAGGLARIESSRSISRSDEGGSEATRILVIDDEPAIRAMIRRVLQAYDVVEAASGEEGRQILAEDQSFDLILCDVMMPNVSGMDLHRWLAESFPEVATRVVFITGGAFTPRAREYLERVGNLRLEKPFNVRQLKALVASRTGLR